MARPPRRERSPLTAEERTASLRQVAQWWPEQPSALLRLTAVAHDVDEQPDACWAAAPVRLKELCGVTEGPLEPSDVALLTVAALVCFERVDYRTWESTHGAAMVLRDALGEDDLDTLAANVRFSAMVDLEIRTPDDVFSRWERSFAALERTGYAGWDIAEYVDAQNVRTRLQRFASAISWAGQERWRAHIEPVDERFRACTVRIEGPLALTWDGKVGDWWHYRVPAGAPTDWMSSVSHLNPSGYLPHPRGGFLRVGFLWELAERPDGLRAMTDRELARWTAHQGRQAEHEASRGGRGPWTDRWEAAVAERRRRDRREPPTHFA